MPENETVPSQAKRTIKLKPTMPGAAAGGAAGLKLRPSTPAAQPTGNSEPTQISPLQTHAPSASSMAAMANHTIKLMPRKPGMIPSPVVPGAAPVPPSEETATKAIPLSAIAQQPSSGEMTSTVRLGVQNMSQSTATVNLGLPQHAPGTAAPSSIKLESPTPAATPHSPTIKLGAPNAAPAPHSPTIKLGAPNAATPAAQTIKLGAPNTAPAPHSPTIKLGAPNAAAHTPIALKATTGATTIKLGAPKSATQAPPQTAPNAVTVKLETPAAEPAAAAKPKLSLKKTEPASEAALPPSMIEPVTETGKQEPSVLFTICSAVAAVVILISAVIAAAQFSNIWNGTSIQIPGLSSNK